MLWAVSRAPLAKLQAYKGRMGWSFPWASSSGSDFNYDTTKARQKIAALEGPTELWRTNCIIRIQPVAMTPRCRLNSSPSVSLRISPAWRRRPPPLLQPTERVLDVSCSYPLVGIQSARQDHSSGRLSRSAFRKWFRFAINPWWGFLKVLEQRWTEPPFHLSHLPQIPIPATFLSHPL